MEQKSNYLFETEAIRTQMERSSFAVKGGLKAGRKFINAIQLCSLSVNLGDYRSIITHPPSTTHSKLSDAEREEVGISLGMIRLSLGLEHHQVIWNDIKTALDA
jgi:O-succinylhomoserine sulfhydrylase